MTFYAHSVPGRPIADWEELAVHLAEVGGESAALAAHFGRAAAGAAGLLHGVGKSSRPMSAERASGGDRSTAGARCSTSSMPIPR